MIDLQYCISFRYKAKCYIYAYIYIYIYILFADYFLLKTNMISLIRGYLAKYNFVKFKNKIKFKKKK